MAKAEVDYSGSNPGEAPEVRGTIFQPSVVIHPNRLEMHENSRFDAFVLVNCVGGVSIGDQSVVHAGSRITGSGGFEMGNRSVVTYNAVLVTSCPDPSGTMSSMVPKTEVNREVAPITLEDETFVGSNAVITPGVTLYEGSVVGAGCFIDRDVPPWTIVYPDGSTRERVEEDVRERERERDLADEMEPATALYRTPVGWTDDFARPAPVCRVEFCDAVA